MLVASTDAMVNRLATAIVDEIKNNAEVDTTLTSSLNSIFTAGVPVATDGGLALQTAWKLATAAGAKDSASGGIS